MEEPAQKENKFLSLAEASEQTGYHQDYLGFLARTGKLVAEKIGRNWVTTQYALDAMLGVEHAEKNTPASVTSETLHANLAQLKNNVIKSMAERAGVAAATTAIAASAVTASNLQTVKASVQHAGLMDRLAKLSDEIESKIDAKFNALRESISKSTESGTEAPAQEAQHAALVSSLPIVAAAAVTGRRTASNLGLGAGLATAKINLEKLQDSFRSNFLTAKQFAFATAFGIMVIGGAVTGLHFVDQHALHIAMDDAAKQVALAPSSSSISSTTPALTVPNTSIASNGTSSASAAGVTRTVYIQGKPGPQGPQGAAGPQGVQGVQGEQGTAGAPGTGGASYFNGPSGSGSIQGVTELSANDLTVANNTYLNHATISNANITGSITVGGSSVFNGTVTFNGGATTAGAFSALNATNAPQFTAGYDTANNWTSSTNSNGATTFAFNGTAPSATFMPQVDSANAFQFTNAAASPVLDIDTANGIVAVTGNLTATGSVSADSLTLNNALTVPNGGTGDTSLTQFGLLYGNGTGAVGVTSAGAPGQCLISNGTSAPTYGSCSNNGVGIISWDQLLSPAANLALDMDHYTTNFTYGAATGAGTNLFNLTDTTNNTGTGYLFTLDTASGSALSPFDVSAHGVSALSVGANGLVTANNLATSGATITGGTETGVAITADTINNTPIGATGASTGAFTTLSVTGTSTLAALITTGITTTGGYTQSGNNANTFTGTTAFNAATTANNFDSSGATITGGSVNGTPIGNTTPSTGSFTTLTGSSLALSNALTVPNGGTGDTTLTIDGVLFGNSTNSVQATLAPTAGQFLLGNASGVPTFTTASGDATISSTGVITLKNTGTPGTYGSASAVPVFTTDAQGRVTGVTNTAIAINANQITSGQLAIANGGTNSSAIPTAGAIAYGTGTAYAFNAAGNANQLLTSGGTGVPTFQNISGLLTAGSNINITGTTNATIAVSSTPTFTTLAVTGDTTFGGNVALSSTAPVIDTTVGTLSINTITNKPVTFGTGLVTANNFASSNASITGGSVNGTQVGNVTPSTGSFTTLAVSGTSTIAGLNTTSITTTGGYTQSGTGANTFTGATAFNGATTANNFASSGASITGGSVNGTPVGNTIPSTGSFTTLSSTSAPTFGSALTVPNGGTGDTTLTTDGVLFGNSTNAIQATLAPTAGQFLIGNASGVPTFTTASGDATISSTGVITLKNTGTPGTYGSASSVPVFTTDAQGRVTGVTNTSIAINANQITSGQVAIAQGGTNSTATPTAGAVAYGTGSAYAFNAAGNANQLLTSGGTGAPIFQNISSLLTAGSNINITGTTNATIAVSSTPTFTTIGVTGNSTLGGNVTLSSTTPVIDATAGTLSINTTTNKPVIFGTGLVTANNFASSGAVITGGSINGTSVGATTASTGAFTTLISTGATTLASAAGSSVAIGNSTGTLSVTSSGLNVSTTGGLTGVSGITTSGGYTQSGTGANTFTGATALNGATTANNFASSGATITGGSVNGTPIGATTPSTGKFTTLTSTGSPSFGSALTVPNGGTGDTTLTSNGVLFGNGTSAIQATLAPTAGQFLIGNASGVPTFATASGDATISSTGVITLKNTGTPGTYGSASAVPVFTTDAQGRVTGVTNTAIAIDASQITSGQLAIANGGTNSTATPTSGAIAYGTGTAYAFNAAGNANQILTSGGSAAPTFQNISSLLTAGSNINITGTTNATIAVSSTPTFTTIGVTGNSTLGGNVILNSTNPVIDATAGTLSINTVTNEPVTFGTGLVTANNFASSNANITGGSVNGTPIGVTTASTGAFTTLTATGATTLASTAGSSVAIGNATGTLSVTSSGLNVSSTGGLTGVSGITTSGGYTQSGTGVNTFTGATTANNFASSGATITGGSVNGTPIGATNASTGSFTTVNTTGNITETNTTAATSGANQNSPSFAVQGTYWNGSASSNDGWSLQDVVGTGTNPTSTLTFTHSGSTGSTNISIPSLALASALTVPNGGTGDTTLTTDGVLFGNGTSAIQATLAPTAGQFLIGNASGVPTFATASGDATISSTGVITLKNTGTLGTYGSASSVPVFTTDPQGRVTGVSNTPIAISASQVSSGQLAIAQGGTNSTATPTAGAIAYGTGTAYAFNAAGNTNQVLTSGGSGAPTFQNEASLLTAGSNINISGTTNATIAVISTPSFATLTVTGNTSLGGNLAFTAAAPVINATAGTLSINTVTNEPVTFGTGLVTADNFASSNANITGGSINGTPVGATTASTGAFTNLTSSGSFSQTGNGTFSTGTGAVSLNGPTTANNLASSGATITGGSVNGTPVGNTSASTGSFTSLAASGNETVGGTFAVSGTSNFTGAATFNGGSNINGQLSVLSTTVPQFSASYDTANKWTSSTNAQGLTTFAFAGSGPGLVVTPSVNTASTFEVTNALGTPVVTVDTSGNNLNVAANLNQSGATTFSTGTGAVSLNGNTTVANGKTLNVTSGATTLGGTLAVTGTTILTGATTANIFASSGATITGGSINGTPIGNMTPSTGVFTNLTSSGNFAQSGTGTFSTGTGAVSLNGATTANTFASSGATITGGAIDNTPIGATTPSTGAFTSLADSGNANIGGTFNVTGAAILSNTLHVTGAATENNFNSSGATITGGTIDNTSIGATTPSTGAFTSLADSGTFLQSGTGTFGTGTGAVSLNGPTTANNFTSSGAAITGGSVNGTPVGNVTPSTGVFTTLTDSGNFIQSGTGTFSTGTGAVSLNGPTTANNFASSGATITGGTIDNTPIGATTPSTGVFTNLNANGNITQSGSGTFSTGTGAVSLNGNTTVANGKTLNVTSGATTLGGTLAVTGNTSLSTLGVSGASTFTGAVTANNFASSDVAITGGAIDATPIGATTPATGSFTNLTVSGTTTFTGGTTFTGPTSASGSFIITSTTRPQLTVDYDSSNGWTASTTSTGATTFAFNGTSPSATFTPSADSASAFQFTNAVGASLLTLDTSGNNLDIATNLNQSGSTTFSTGTGAVSLNGNTTIASGKTFTVTNGATVLGGNLSVAGTSILTGATTANIFASSGATITGGSINGTAIGATTPSTGAFTNLNANGNIAQSGTGTFSTGTGSVSLNGPTTANNFASNGAAITGGAINNTPIGNVTPSTGAFTTLAASGTSTLANITTSGGYTQSGTGANTFTGATTANNFVSSNAAINGGAINNTPIGNVTPSTGAFTNITNSGNFLQSGTGTFGTGTGAVSLNGPTTANNFTSSNAAITGGSVNGTAIGATTPSTGAFTSLADNGNETIGGTLGVTGATTLGNTLNVSGATTLSGSLLQNGNATIAAAAGSATSIGNSTGTFALSSTGLNVSTGGALTGISGITTSGGYTQSGSGANTFTGSTTANNFASSSAAITGGSINGTAIGATTPSTGAFTTISSTSNANVGGTLGVTGATTLNSTLAVTGNSILSGNLGLNAAAPVIDSSTGTLSINTVSNKQVTFGTGLVTANNFASSNATITGGSESGVVVSGGSINNTPVGNTTPSTGAFTTLQANAATTLNSTLTLNSSTYSSPQELLNDGVTTTATYPGGITPAFTVDTSETGGSRPLFFGYQNSAGSGWDSYLTAGACGSFTQMCLDIGSSGTNYTALAQAGSTLVIGGNTNTPAAAVDGNSANIYFGNTGNTYIPNGTLNVGSSNQFQVSNSGALTTTAINTSGAYTQSGSGANTFTGATTANNLASSGATITGGTIDNTPVGNTTPSTGAFTNFSATGTVTLPNASVANSALQNGGALTVAAGTGLTGGGSVALGGTTTLSLPNVGSAGTYGSSTQVPVITTDAQGRITGVVNTTITGISAATVPWSGLTNPTSALSLSMGSNVTTFTYGATTGAANLFNLSDTANNTGTGYLLNVSNATGSTLNPFNVSAHGTSALAVSATGLVTANNFASSGATITGGAINNTPIGASGTSTAAFTTLGATGTSTLAAINTNGAYTQSGSGANTFTGATTANTFASSGATITGGSVNGTPVGNTTASTGAFTNLNASGTVAFTNALTVPNGGTGDTTFTSAGVLYGNSTGALQATTAPTSAQVLVGNASGIPAFVTLSGDATITSAGVVTLRNRGISGTYGSASSVPVFTTDPQGRVTGVSNTPIAISASQVSSGQLAIAQGGTNSTATPTAGAIAYGTGSAYAFSASGNANQILTSGGTSTPTFQNLASLLTAGSNINITGSTNATIAVSSTPSFSTLGVIGNTTLGGNVSLTATSPVIDSTAGTLSINTVTNKPVTFGTGLVTANTFASSNATITGGLINGTPIGVTTASTGKFTSLAANGQLTVNGDNILGASGGNIILTHPTSGWASSIVFPSAVNAGSDYGAITYYDNDAAYAFWGTGSENSALVIGAQNDADDANSDVVALEGAAGDVLGSASYPTTLLVNDFGNVGIGNTAPTHKLDVNGTAGINGTLGIVDTLYNLNNNSSLSLASSNVQLIPNGSVVLTALGSNGNVGIGTTNPQEKLHVTAPDVAVTGMHSSYGSGDLVIEGTDTTRSTTKGAALTFAIPANTDGTNTWEQGRILVAPDNNNSSDADGRMYLQTSYSDGSWEWRNNLVLTANGNVGVDTTSPAALFSVGATSPFQVDNSGNVSTSGNLTVSGATNLNGATTVNALTSSGATITGGSINGTPIGASTASTGNFTNLTASNLTVSGATSYGTLALISTTAPQLAVGYDTSHKWTASTNSAGSTTFAPSVDTTTAFNFTNSTGGSVLDVDTANGNVGIGTTNPVLKLQVAGEVGATNGFRVASNNGDDVNAAPWYGLGLSNVTLPSGGAPATQVAGYSGLNFLTQSGQLAITQGGNIGIGTTAPGTKLSVAGQITANEGSFGSGGYSFNGDGGYDTGLFSPADGVLDFYNNTIHSINVSNTGQTTFYQNVNFPGSGIWNTSGNVGIGTTSPSTLLDIASALTANSPTITLENTSGSTVGAFGPGIIFNNHVSSTHPFIINQFQDANSSLQIANSNSPYTTFLTVTQAGNIGIGTSSPAGLLDVGSNASGLVIPAVNLDPALGYSLASLQNTNKLLIGNNLSGGTAETDFVANRSSAYTGGYRFYDYTNTGTITPLVTIQGSGNVGIGTTTPTSKLSVAADDSRTTPSQLVIEGSSNLNQQLIIGYNTTSNYGSIQSVNEGVTFEPLSLNPSGGNVGIGGITNPSSALDVAGSTGLRIRFASYTANYLGLYNDDSNAYITTVSANTGTYPQNLVLSPASNVGIKTSTPGSLLSVAGGASIGSGFASTAAPSNGEIIQGNVGIGTSDTTGAALTIQGPVLGSTSGNTTSILSLRNSDSNANYLNFLQIRNGNGSDWTTATTRIQNVTDVSNQAYIDFNPVNGQDSIAFGNAGSEFVRIGSTGNLGVGTSTPSYKLDVNGNGRFSGGSLTVADSNSTGNITLGDGNINKTPGSGFKFDSSLVAPELSIGNGYSGDSSPSNGAIIQGNVGIGTTNPARALDVYGSQIGITSTGVYGPSIDITNTNTGGHNWRLISSGPSDAAGAGKFLFVDSSTTRMVIDTNGNVGIGINSPAQKLDVQGYGSFSDGTQGLLIGAYAGGSGIGAIYPYGVTPNSTNYAYAASTGGDTDINSFSGSIQLATQGISRLSVTNGGNVGIGNASPTDALDVSGITHISTSATGPLLQVTETGTTYSAGAAAITANTQNATGTANYLYAGQLNGATVFTVRADGQGYFAGNVGIGTTTPDAPLRIQSSSDQQIRFTHSGVRNVDLGIDSSGSFNIGDYGNNFFSINSSGNVGIGTSNPQATENIAGNGSLLNGKGLLVGTLGDAGNTNVALGAETARFEIGFPGYRDVEPNQIGAKIAAIRTNTYVNNNAAIQGTDLAFYTGQGNDGNSTSSELDITNERLRITNAGLVGIGTPSPAYTLDVNGTIHSNSTITAASFSGPGTGLTGTAGGLTSGSSNFVNSPDGDRNAANKLPDTSGQGVRFDFANASSTDTGGSYSGVMTYAPWTGTTASTGDASYQLAFGSAAANAAGIPELNIRNGIDSTWNAWNAIALLQPTTGTQESGNLNISGNGLFGGSVGIGTTAPGTKLSVAGQITANEGSFGSGGYSFNGDGGYDTGMFSPADGVLDFYNNTTHSININTTGSATFYQNVNFPGSGIWNTSGNVGIGTTTPTSLLSVQGTAPTLSIKDTTSGGDNYILRNGVVNTGEFDIYDTSGSTSMLSITSNYNNNGQVMIGTNTNPAPGNNSRLFVFGGTNGANIDLMGDKTIYGGIGDVADDEVEGSDYGTGSRPVDSIAMRFFGPSFGAALPSYTILGDPTAQLGELDFGDSAYSVIQSGTATPIQIGINNSEVARFTTTGLGIGTTNPTEALQVGDNSDAGNAIIKNGYLCVGNGSSSGNGSCAVSGTAGTIYANSTSVGQGDFAESYLSNNLNMQPGMVVTSDAQIAGNMVSTTGKGYDQELTGVVSTAPGVTIGNADTAKPPVGEKAYPIALNGRVPVLVTDENGAVQPGDYLTSSASMPGYAMKATHAGTIIGQALGSFSSSTSDSQTQSINGATFHTGSVTLFIHIGYQNINNTFVFGSDDLTVAQTAAQMNSGNGATTQGTTQTGSLASAATSATYIIRQNPTGATQLGSILQLQSGSAIRMMVASDGATAINAQSTTPNENLFVVSNNGSSLFSIDASGNVQVAATLVVKKDIASLGEVLGTSAILARNGDSNTLHQGDLVMLMSAQDSPIPGNTNPLLVVQKATAADISSAQSAVVVGIVDRDLSDFDIPGAPNETSTDKATVPNNDYMDIVTGGTYEELNVDASQGVINVGDKLTISDNAGYARKMLPSEAGTMPLVGVALDAVSSGTGHVRVYLMLNNALATTAVTQQPSQSASGSGTAPSAPAPAPTDGSSTDSSADPSSDSSSTAAPATGSGDSAVTTSSAPATTPTTPYSAGVSAAQ